MVEGAGWRFKSKSRPLAHRGARVTAGRRLLLRYGVAVMSRPPLGSLQPRLQLARLLRGLARVPQGALDLANALLQLPVPPLRRDQSLLHPAAPLLLLEERGLHRGAHQLERGGGGGRGGGC